jgi:hypothetical protein
LSFALDASCPSLISGLLVASVLLISLSLALLMTFCLVIVDVSYAAPQAHRIINVALHREYSLGIIFIFS